MKLHALLTSVLLAMSSMIAPSGKAGVPSLGLPVCIGVASLAAAAAGAWLRGRRVAAALALLAGKAEALARADGAPSLARRATSPRASLAKLSVALDSLRASARLQARALRDAEARGTRLERLLEERTADLAARDAEMRHLLDHVPVGILTVDAEGRIGRDRSLAAECLLGVPESEVRLSTHLAAVDAAFARRLDLGWEQVSSGVLPLELALDQLPKQLHVGHHQFRTSFIPGSAGARYLVVIEETTDAVRRTSEEEANLELAASFAHFLKDREAFLEFLSDASELAATITESKAVDARLRHALHTLKGNALMMGLEPLGHHCHVLESLIAATGDLPARDARDKLHSHVRRLRVVYGATEPRSDGRVPIRLEDHDALIDAIRRGAPEPDILARARALLQEPVSTHFERLAEQTASLAVRLRGAAPTFTFVGASLRLDRRRFARFWSALVHVMRNAITHGIEPASERARRLKPPRGGIVFAAHLSETELVIDVSDDGRGIDWEGIRASAIARGLPSESQSALVAALFAEGVSTAQTTDELAGRGVGLGAVLAAVRELDGSVSVESSGSTGTLFRFGFPRVEAALADAAPHRRRVAGGAESDANGRLSLRGVAP